MRDEMPDLKRVAIALVDQLDMTHARAGLISFSGAASEDQVLTDSHDALHTAINSLQAGGATNIVAALTAAADHFASNGRGGNVQKVVWFISDGQQNARFGGDRTAITTAQDVRTSDGVRIFAVGFDGSSVDTLEAMASAPSSLHAFMGSNLADIQNRFSDFCTLVHSPSPPPSP